MDNIATETAHPADDGESPEVTAPLLEQGPQGRAGGPGSLFMVATPIGNVLDMSPRARQVLESADLVLAEDTRRSLQLCRELGVRVRRITSFHDHNEQEKEPEMLERLARGENLALISDAGTPVIADPGYRLARAAGKKASPFIPYQVLQLRSRLFQQPASLRCHTRSSDLCPGTGRAGKNSFQPSLRCREPWSSLNARTD